MKTLEEIKSTIDSSLKKFDKAYSRQLYSEVDLINEINTYLSSHSGKQIRPLLVLLSAEAGLASNPNPQTYDSIIAEKIKLAIAMEILHNSSLMHDDVVDESQLRRGRETVKQKWSNKIAVLCGDFYLAQVMNILYTINKKDIYEIIDHTVIEMSEGELLQQQVSHQKNLEETNYYNVIYKKTASLMAACCEIGYGPLRNFGYHFGMAFQIRDDIMDYHSVNETGKPQGNDIKECKMTLPLLCYLKHIDKETQLNTLQLLNRDYISDENADNIINQVRASGALEEANIILQQRINDAKKALDIVSDSKYKIALIDLVNLLEIK